MLRVISLAIVGLLASAPLLAADNGIYLGAGVTQSKVEAQQGGFNLDDEDTKYKIIVGVRPLDWLAIEANYIDFGTVEAQSGSNTAAYRLKGFDAFLVGLLEIQVIDFYVKAGVVRFDRDLQVNNVQASFEDDTGFEPAFGGGIQAHIGSLSVRAEYEIFKFGDDTDLETDVDAITVGVTWTFL